MRTWRRRHRWWLLLAFLAALGGAFVIPAAGGLLLAGCGVGLWLKASWIGRLEEAGEALLVGPRRLAERRCEQPGRQGGQGLPHHRQATRPRAAPAAGPRP
ncbi:hypothetical protein SHIRM173S_07378 [Streptomyces hirsutus]